MYENWTKFAGLRQEEEKNPPDGSWVVLFVCFVLFLQIFSVYFFSVGVNIHSSLLAKSFNSPTATNCISRLLIYCNILILRNQTFTEKYPLFILDWAAWPPSLQVSQIPAAPLPYTYKYNPMPFRFSNNCSWQCWRSSFLQAVGQHRPAFDPISPTRSPTPSFFPLTCSSSAWNLFARNLSGPISPHLADYIQSLAALCCACI